MVKLGLFFEFVGFCILFWQSAARPYRKIENGGGSPTTTADEESQTERVLSWIPFQSLRSFFAKYLQIIAFGFISIGVLFQLLSCSK